MVMVTGGARIVTLIGEANIVTLTGPANIVTLEFPVVAPPTPGFMTGQSMGLLLALTYT